MKILNICIRISNVLLKKIIDWWATTFFFGIAHFNINNVFFWIGINSISFLAIPIFFPNKQNVSHKFHIHENRNYCNLHLKNQVIIWFFITTKWIKVTCVIWIAKSSNKFYLWLVSYEDFSTSWTIFLHIFFVKNDFTNFNGTFSGRF